MHSMTGVVIEKYQKTFLLDFNKENLCRNLATSRVIFTLFGRIFKKAIDLQKQTLFAVLSASHLLPNKRPTQRDTQSGQRCRMQMNAWGWKWERIRDKPAWTPRCQERMEGCVRGLQGWYPTWEGMCDMSGHTHTHRFTWGQTCMYTPILLYLLISLRVFPALCYISSFINWLKTKKALQKQWKYLLQVIVWVIFCVCNFPQVWWLNRVWCRSVCVALLSMHQGRYCYQSPLCAIHCSYGRNKGASWSKGKKWGACFDTLCFRSNSQGSQYFGNKARKLRGACWWSKRTFSKISLGQFNCLWSLNMREVVGFTLNHISFSGNWTWRLKHHLLVMKTIETHSPSCYCMFLCHQYI